MTPQEWQKIVRAANVSGDGVVAEAMGFNPRRILGDPRRGDVELNKWQC